MKMAYLLLVHSKPNQLNKYLNQLLSYKNADIFIHVNKKNQEMCSQIIKHPNVHIFSEYDVRWGSYEIVQSCIFLMEKALEKGGYDFVHFGSGQDLVIKSGISDFLSKNKDKIFIRTNREEIKDDDVVSTMYRIKWPRKLMVAGDVTIHRIIRLIMSKIYLKGLKIRENKNKLPENYKIYLGGTWFTMPFEAAEYIISFLNSTPDYIKYFYDSLAPDTYFFQTILMNSKYRDNIADELTYVKFGDNVTDRNHPVIIKKEHIKELEKSDKFFARKFDENIDGEVIDYFTNKIL